MPEVKVLPFVSVCLIFGLITFMSVLYSIESEKRLAIMERKLQDLEQKYNRLQEIISSQADVETSDMYDVSTENANTKTEPTQMTFNNVNQLPQDFPSKLLRIKRGSGDKRKKKRCKSCLPSVEFEGSGIGAQRHQGKNDPSGLWQPALWVMDSPTSKNFKFESINKDGAVSVKKTGLYLIYAQMNLIGIEGGFKIEKFAGKEIKKNSLMSKPSTLLTYKQTLHNGSSHDNRTGFTMRIVKLIRDDVIFIRELEHNQGAYYDHETLFGMIQIGK